MRVVHAIAGLDPAYGGPSYSVPSLCRALAGLGAEIELLSVGRGGAPAPPERTYRNRTFPQDYTALPILRELRCSGCLKSAMAAAASQADVVHNHGIWLMPNIAAGRAAARSGKPFVVSTRGMLSPAALAFSRLKKRMFWRLLQGSSVRAARCLHATSEQEYAELRTFGLVNPVAVIPNGVDVPEELPMTRSADERVVLALGRIHPKKGLDDLLRAWARIEHAHPDWRLRIAGPAEDGHDTVLRRLAHRLNLARASIEGPVYGAAKRAAYEAAELFVLPTRNENFGMAAAEALAAGIPAIVTKRAPWSGLVGEGCGWWIDRGIEPLAASMAAAMALPPVALAAMGANGRRWMSAFSWERAAADMLDVYRWCAGRGPAPPVLRFG
ncbi:MAG TPA: glycosyltransferase [Stellaceae bacterium]|nr:glycosyltransferase [Stellaceae bacterium]